MDFSAISEELGLVVPDVYRFFIDASNARGFSLANHGIYDSTEAVIRGNKIIREKLFDAEPEWELEYLDFGIGDGSGNFFFLHASSSDDNLVELWAHDPEGIEPIGSGTEFFERLLAELATGFNGPDRFSFQGNASWQ